MSFNKKTIVDINPGEKRVLMRVDFNVPLLEGRVADDTRMQAALPSIKYLLERGAAVILCSHLGRPWGKVRAELSLRSITDHLRTMLDVPIFFAEDCIGPIAEEAAAALEAGQILVLENTRFHAGEKANSPEMANALAKLADIYVNDAFGSAHRAHASTEGVAHHLPGVAGLLMEREIRYLGKTLEDPARPFLAILGGAKVSDKIDLIYNLLEKTDEILLGGGIANTFFKAKGYAMGVSLVDDEAIETAKELLNSAKGKLRLPLDIVIAERFAVDAEHRSMPVGDLPDGWMVLDIGPKTVAAFSAAVEQAATIVWNGPMGVFEMPTFAKGTIALAKALASSAAQTIVGGGDSAAAMRQSGLADQISHISTGGGASLAMLAGKNLPGLVALEDKE